MFSFDFDSIIVAKTTVNSYIPLAIEFTNDFEKKSIYDVLKKNDEMKIKSVYPDAKLQAVANSAGMLYRFVYEMKIGDYVVHQEYGIGIYLGIETKTLRNNKIDYLHIQYADEGKLYVPVENIYLLEKYNTKFESFLNRIKQNDPKIKISGLVLEDNCIDLQLEKDSRGLYFNFEPKILMIFDENDITYYYRYDRYTYEELEDNLVKLVKNHFN